MADHRRQGQNEMLLYKTLHRKQEQKRIFFSWIFWAHRRCICWSFFETQMLNLHKCSLLTSKQILISLCCGRIQNKKGPLECEQVLESMNKAELSWLSSFKRGSEWDWASVSNLEQLSGANIFWGCQSNKTRNDEEGWRMEPTDWLRCRSVHRRWTHTSVRQECETGTSRLAYAVDVLGHIDICIHPFPLYVHTSHICKLTLWYTYCCSKYGWSRGDVTFSH